MVGYRIVGVAAPLRDSRRLITCAEKSCGRSSPPTPRIHRLRYQMSRPVAAGQRRQREESREHARDEEREEEPSSFTEFRFRKCNESQTDTTHA